MPTRTAARFRLLTLLLLVAVLCVIRVSSASARPNAAPTSTAVSTPDGTFNVRFATPISLLTPSPVASAMPTNAATAPAIFAGTIPATIDLSGAAENVIVALHDANLVPAGGHELFEVPTGYGTTSDPGYSFLDLGHGSAAQNIVISFQVIWYSAGVDSACGLSFRKTDTGLSAVFLTNDKQVLLTQQQGNTSIVHYHKPSSLFSNKSVNTVTVIALDETLVVYINGTLETSATGKSVRGGFALELYNALNNRVVTDCHYRRVWVWTFDDDQPTEQATPQS